MSSRPAAETGPSRRSVLHFGHDVTPALRLYCLAYAGGSASIYRGWYESFRAVGIEVVGLEYPGRGTRMGEPATIDPHDLARAIASTADDVPFAIFGHSLGARVAFEVAHALSAAATPPEMLCVSAAPAPRLPRANAGDSYMSDEDFVVRLLSMGGTPSTFLTDPELVDIFLPVIRSDFRWADEYRYVARAPLNIPILALSASEDPEATVEAVSTWREETSDEFSLEIVPGGHFFIHQSEARVVSLLTEALTTDLPARERHEA